MPLLLADTNVIFTAGLFAAVSLIEVLTLSAFSGGILRRWRVKFFLVCRWLPTNAAIS
jgi:hypothetical protein